MPATYLRPVEAVASRIPEVAVINGTFIIDVTNSKIYYDTLDDQRLDLSSIQFCDSKNDLSTINGVNNKIVITKDTGACYFWDGEWKPVVVSYTANIPDTIYVSASGSDDNNGISSSYPMQTINGALSKYKSVSKINLVLLPGTYSENIIIDSKTYVSIYSDSSQATIAGDIIITNSTVKMNNLEASTITIENSCGSLAEVYLSNGLVINNSTVNIAGGYIESPSIGLSVTNNSIVTLRGTEGAASIGYKVSNGSIVNAIGTVISSSSAQHEISNLGRIFLPGESVDVTTKAYIDSMLEIEVV